MLRFAVALVVCALTAAGCSAGDGSPAGGSASVSSSSGSMGSTAGRVSVVAVYRPVCGPQPLPTAGSTATTCREEPVADVEVVATSADGAVAARATTDRAGRLSFDLAPGTYLLTASPARPPRITPRPTQVTVGTEPVPTVTLVYESSMQ